jgi:hypothetical protein
MARTKEERELTLSDGEVVRLRIIQWKVKDTEAVLTKLSKVLGPALGAAADGLGTNPAEALEGDLSLEGAQAALETFARNLGGDDLTWLREKIRKCTEIATEDGETWVPFTETNLDEVFAGELGAYFRYIAAGLGANFKGFLSEQGGLKGIVKRFTTPTPKGSASPTDAPSGSGA